MSFTVSVRDDRPLEERLRKGLDIEIPDECRHNSNVIYQILKYAPKVIPSFNNLEDGEVKKIADVAAFLIRPDLIKNGYALIGPKPFQQGDKIKIVNESEEPEFSVHLRNNPEDLTPDFEVPAKEPYLSHGAEYFRCYAGAISWIPGLYEKLDPENHSLNPVFKMADLTAHLIDPDDLTDYRYSDEEISNFHKTLRREMEEI